MAIDMSEQDRLAAEEAAQRRMDEQNSGSFLQDIFSAEDAYAQRPTSDMYSVDPGVITSAYQNAGASAKNIQNAATQSQQNAQTQAGQVSASGRATNDVASQYATDIQNSAAWGANRAMATPSTYSDPTLAAGMYGAAQSAGTWTPSADTSQAQQAITRFEPGTAQQTALGALANVSQSADSRTAADQLTRFTPGAGQKSSIATLQGFTPSAESESAMRAMAAAGPGAVQTGGVNSLVGYQPGQLRSEQASAYGQLAAMANATDTPSAAQDVLRQGTERAIAGQLALAQSGRGAGSLAQAQRRAAGAVGALQSQASVEASKLRAEEAATNANRRLTAAQAASGAAQGLQASQTDLAAQRLQALTSGTAAANASDAQRLQQAAQYVQGAQASDAQRLAAAQALGQQATATDAQRLAATSTLGQLAAQEAANRTTQLGQYASAANAADAQRLAGLEAGGQLSSTMDAQQLQALGLTGQLYGTAGEYGLSGQTAADQAAQNWFAQAIGGQQTAANTALTGRAATDQGALNAAQISQAGYGDLLAGTQQAEAARANLLQTGYGLSGQESAQKSAIYQAYLDNITKASLGDQQADVQKDESLQSGIGTAIGAIAALSDQRAKRKIQLVDLIGEAA